MSGKVTLQRLEIKKSAEGVEYVDGFGVFNSGHPQPFKGFGGVVDQVRKVMGDRVASKESPIELGAIVDFRPNTYTDGQGKQHKETVGHIEAAGPVGEKLFKPLKTGDLELISAKIVDNKFLDGFGRLDGMKTRLPVRLFDADMLEKLGRHLEAHGEVSKENPFKFPADVSFDARKDKDGNYTDETMIVIRGVDLPELLPTPA